MLDCSPYAPEITRCVCSKAVRSLPTTIVTMDLTQMVLHRPCRVSPFHALLTYLGLLVSLTCPIRMFAQTSVQPGTFGVKLSGYENLVGGGASVGPGGGAGGRGRAFTRGAPDPAGRRHALPAAAVIRAKHPCKRNIPSANPIPNTVALRTGQKHRLRS